MFCPIFKTGDFKKQKYSRLLQKKRKKEKRWFDLQNVVLKAVCIWQKKNEVIQSRPLVVKGTDVVTMLGRANH